MRKYTTSLASALGATIFAALPVPLMAQEPDAAPTASTTEAGLPSIEQSYAADQGISVAEAGVRLDRMHEAGRLAAQFRANESDTFTGMYVDHGANFGIVALFTADPAGKLKKYNAPSWVRGGLGKYSEKALYQEQKDLLKAIRGNGAQAAAQTRVKEGEIDLFVDDEAALDAALAKAKIKLDPKVKVKKVKSLKSSGEALVYGGYDLKMGTVSKCTAGFALIQNQGTTRYLSTAGHCDDPLNYAGSALPFWFEWWEAGNVYDFQVHTLGTNTVTNSIYVGTTTRQPITSVYPYFSMYLDEYVCKYGQRTYLTCGYVTNLNYSGLGGGGFVRVERDGYNMSEQGDSGAPWYVSRYSEAWGIHSDDPFDDPNDAFFMPASRFEDANLRVLTSP